MDPNLTTTVWTFSAMDSQGTEPWNVGALDRYQRRIDWDNTTAYQKQQTINYIWKSFNRGFSDDVYYISEHHSWLSLEIRIEYIISIIQYFYYPILAIVGVPGKSAYPVINAINHAGTNYCSCYLLCIHHFCFCLC